jgi:hypothetical protein
VLVDIPFGLYLDNNNQWYGANTKVLKLYTGTKKRKAKLQQRKQIFSSTTLIFFERTAQGSACFIDIAEKI